MTTPTKRMTLRLVAALALSLLAACGNGSNGSNDLGGGGSPDMAMTAGADMAQAACVMNPTTAVELLNACTTAQTGDSAKDAPYFPSLAPNGNLPPLP